MQTELWAAPKVIVNGEIEHWKPVNGFIRYEVSTLGRFRRKITGKLLNGTCVHNGYLHVGLIRDGEQVWKLAHRLVAETFLEKPSAKHEVVNHKNRIRTDNRIANLEWSTRSHNAKHAKRQYTLTDNHD